MLPSTGYFKDVNCPFYDSGLCERPYCHFRHVKKETQPSASGEGIGSSDYLHQLVSEAVKKVLQQTESASAETQSIDTKTIVQVLQKATYNPTPISELKKITSTDSENDESVEQRRKHIPVPYTPRKPPSLPIKKPEENGEGQHYIYTPPQATYLPGSTESTKLDTYTPQGTVELPEKYLPGTESKLPEYKPVETKSPNSVNYVPSDKTFHKKKLLEYKPSVISSNCDKPKVVYQPTPKSQAPCFSSDEDEPTTKKTKLSSDFNGLDELGAEFDMLGEILDEEKTEQKSKHKINKSESEKTLLKSVSHSKDKKSTDHIKHRHKNENSDRSKSEKDKDKRDKSHDKKHSGAKPDSKSSSSHKSSSKDKERSKERDKRKDQDTKSKDKNESHTCKSKSSKPKSNNSDKTSTKSSEKKCKSDSKHSKSTHKSSRDKEKSKDRKEKHKPEKTETISDSENIVDDFMDVEDEPILELSEDEDSIALECKRIFEEYVPSAKPQCAEDHAVENEVEEEYVPTKKRISRTVDKNIKVTPKAPVKPDYKGSAAQQMADRLAKVREYHAAKIASAPAAKIDPPKNIMHPASISSNSKIRIAHVPYASSLVNAKIARPPQKPTPVEPSTSTTVQTVQKGTKRVAHMPNEKFIDRPGVLEPLASKIPANIRSTYLNMMIDECLKIYISPVDAYARAQHEELNTSKKCKAIQIYKNSALLAVSRLRKECLECNGIKKSGLDCSTLQKVSGTVTGIGSNAGSWSIENKNKKAYDNPYEYKGARLYENIKKWVLTEEQLQENGFPRPHPSGEKGRATIKSENKQKPPKGIFRTCCRCSKEYTVDKKGIATVKEECVYHPNRKYRYRGEVKYQCCSQDGMSDGCCVAPCHVYDYVDYENLRGYVKTMPPERPMDDYGVYSLDCEMCYTTHGLDLTRITVIDSSCKVVYETLIKPLHAIIDYNTRYSGITEEQMANVSTTLLEVQATLLAMFNDKTILIGHSLESDFKALKLIHNTVIDTSVLFPHKMGPPYKRALRNLSSEHLKKIIQNSVEGHNSAEDATVCMELIHYKLKEDLKSR